MVNIFVQENLYIRFNWKISELFYISQMYVNNSRLKDPAEATSLGGIMTKICACARSFIMVAAMVTEITSSQNQSVNSNACSLVEVEVNVKMLSNLYDKSVSEIISVFKIICWSYSVYYYSYFISYIEILNSICFHFKNISLLL